MAYWDAVGAEVGDPAGTCGLASLEGDLVLEMMGRWETK